ncbi:MAG: ATP-binding protein [Clostridiales bacterium]
MKIAVLSGKGGTGKTTVSASLALSLDKFQYVDCDVEEPNGYIFLKPKIDKSTLINVLIPKINEAKCNYCGECGKACQYNAIAVIKENVLLFPEICHHCGACVLTCKQKAIDETERNIGVIESTSNNDFMQGLLNVGEPISMPIIRKLKKYLRKDVTVILDCPPGASCSVVESIEGCDYCVLVTEPTPFGLHDLKIAVKLVKKMEIPFGVVINKASQEDLSIQNFCSDSNIEILMEIPYSKEIAQAYSNGILPIYLENKYKESFVKLYEKMERSTKK